MKLKTTRGARQYMNRRVRGELLLLLLPLHCCTLQLLLVSEGAAPSPPTLHTLSLTAATSPTSSPLSLSTSQGGFNRSLDVEKTGEKVRIEWLRQ